jgi:predicted amidohydrolase
MNPLVLAVAQPHVTPLDVARNAVTHAASVRAAAARLVVFPEMSLTGYELDAPLLAEDDARLDPLVAACAATDTVALVGAPVDGPHIAMLAIDGDGARVVYRKQHPHQNEERFAAGPGPAVFEIDGWRLGLAICRDTGVATHAASTADLGMDAYIAGAVDKPEAADEVAEKARTIARTYGVWVGFSSFAGPTGGEFDVTAGRSGIWSPDGSVAARAGQAPGEMARATLFHLAHV